MGSVKVVAVATTLNDKDTECASWAPARKKQAKRGKKTGKHHREQADAHDKITSVTLRYFFVYLANLERWAWLLE